MIRTDNISFSIGQFCLDDFNIEIDRGQSFVMLGPPGSGKSIFLECLCGLKRPGSGRIFLDDIDVTNVQPRARRIGYVPQDYAVFPHLSVRGNIEFGLKANGFSKELSSDRVLETASLLGIDHLLDRTTDGLSGGERQRVALARALVLEPSILLLDEPVCALDEATRQSLCAELLALHRKLNLTTIHVSHNLEEAFSIADSGAVLNNGKLIQTDTLANLMRRPKNEFVARFMRCENIYSCELLNRQVLDALLPEGHLGSSRFMIRSENVVISPVCGSDPGPNIFEVKIRAIRDCGNYFRLELTGEFDIIAHVSPAEFARWSFKCSDTVFTTLGREHIHLLSD